MFISKIEFYKVESFIGKFFGHEVPSSPILKTFIAMTKNKDWFWLAIINIKSVQKNGFFMTTLNNYVFISFLFAKDSCMQFISGRCKYILICVKWVL